MPEREGLHPSGYLGCGSIGFRSSASRIREDSEDQGQGAGRATATKVRRNHLLFGLLYGGIPSPPPEQVN